jgi:hypothetical protein
VETQDHLDGFRAALPPQAIGILFKQYNGEPLTDEQQEESVFSRWPGRPTGQPANRTR